MFVFWGMDFVSVGQRSINIPLQLQYLSAMKLLLEVLTKGRATHVNKT